MNAKQAIEISDYIYAELLRNDFIDVIEELNVRSKEYLDEYNDIEEKDQGQNFWNPIFRLEFVLSNLINIFQSRSNDNYPQLLEKLNKYSFSSEGKQIESISVELFDSDNQTYDLKELPSYQKLILEFTEILYLLKSEN